MPFNFQEMMADPQFQAGLSLFGASTPGGAPLAEAMKQQQAMRIQQQKMLMEQAELEQHQARTRVYQQQTDQAARKQAMNEKLFEQLSKEMGDGQQQPAQLQQLQQPAQQPQQAPMLGAQPQQQQPPNPLDMLHSKMKFQESRNRQWDDKGQPLLGPVIPGRNERAVGSNQIMPSTGPEAAKLAGLEWNKALFMRQKTGVPELDAETEQYHDALGKAYLGNQLTTFKRPDQAAAAYNAGPARVQQAVRLAEQMKKPDAWLTFLPKETQDYVAKTAPAQPSTPEQPLPPSGPLGVAPAQGGMVNRGLKYQRFAALAGVLEGDTKPLGEYGKALKPDTYKPGDTVVDPATGQSSAVPDPLGERRVAADESNAATNAARAETDKAAQATREAAETRLNEQSKREAEAAKQAAIDTANLKKAQIKQTEQETSVIKGTQQKAVETVDFSMDEIAKVAKELKAHKGLPYITGKMSYIPAGILGDKARNADAIRTQLESQAFVQGTLAIRQASPTGAGVGNQSNWEGGALKDAFARLGRAQSTKAYQDALDKIVEITEQNKQRIRKAYETSIPNSGTIDTLPPGAAYEKTVNGKKVYKLPNGSKFREE